MAQIVNERTIKPTKLSAGYLVTNVLTLNNDKIEE